VEPKLRLVDEADPSTHPRPERASLLFGNALDLVPFPCLRVDDQGAIVAINTAAAEFLGINPARKTTCVMSAFLAPGHTTAFFQFLGRIVRTEQDQRCTIPIRSQSGAERVVQFDARREGASSTLLSLIDVSEREYALTRLRGSEQRMRSLLEALPDAVFVIDDGTIVHCNPAAYRIAAMPPVGRSFASLLEPEQCPILSRSLGDAPRARTTRAVLWERRRPRAQRSRPCGCRSSSKAASRICAWPETAPSSGDSKRRWPTPIASRRWACWRRAWRTS
jgi:PAS domain-containing protein